MGVSAGNVGMCHSPLPLPREGPDWRIHILAHMLEAGEDLSNNQKGLTLNS